MTYEEAISELETIKRVYANMRKEYKPCVEALQMAIDLLRQADTPQTEEFKNFDREALILLIECQKERIEELLADKDTPQKKQSDSEYYLELADAVMRGEMSDASANQAWYEYINKQDTPQTEAPRQMRTFSEGGIGYTPQTDCSWK